MANKVALVTGAGQGIGEAIAKRLAKDGFSVVLVARHMDKLQEVADEIKKNGGEAFPVTADVSKREEVFAAVQKAVDQYGDFNVIVNNAGVAPTTPIDTVTKDDLDYVHNQRLRDHLGNPGRSRDVQEARSPRQDYQRHFPSRGGW